MPPTTHVQQCAALICAYITGDVDGCTLLRDTSDLTYLEWYESATVLCATVMDLIAFDLDSHPFVVIDRCHPCRHEIFPGPRHAQAASTVVVYYDLHHRTPEPDRVGVNVIPSLFDITVNGIEQLALLWGRPSVEIARLLAVTAATHERDTW